MPPKHKTVTREARLAQEGINVVERVVLAMGSRWTQVGNGLDVGIDGIVELCNAEGGALGLMLHVQSKAVENEFQNETNEGFDYYCKRRDIDYWLQGNAPVLLIVSRPSKGEAYWISIKHYFEEPSSRSTTKVHFDKQHDRFDMDARARLFDVAASRDGGLHLAPLPKQERLFPNLLPLISYAPKIFVAPTSFRGRGEVEGALADSLPGLEWILRKGLLLSFHELSAPPWDKACEASATESFDAGEWAKSNDADRSRDFVSLLNLALTEKLRPMVDYHSDEEVLFFVAPKDRREMHLEYQNLTNKGSLAVFKPYAKKSDATQISSYRHMSFGGRFKRFDSQWYLEITPTYLFTHDGEKLHAYHQEKLAGIKRFEGNRAVLSQILLWADVLARGGDLFTPSYPFLEFGKLETMQLDVGIEDDAWLKREEEKEKLSVSEVADDLFARFQS
jgi:hypothetical protein